MPPTSATATVLFTDMVGSTALRSELGEEKFEVLRRTHDRLVRHAIIAHSGTILKGLGDGALATFSACADAIAAAVAIQQAIHAHNRRTGTSPLAVRVGMSAGDVSWDDGDCHGLPVVEASRLCAAAEGGAIVVSEVVRVLAHGRGGWSYTSVGPLKLKGLPQPLPACTVMWEPLPEASMGVLPEASTGVRVPLPPYLARREQFRFAGRATELGTLRDVWRSARDATARAALIGGEPGIGKTRLAAELARTVHAEGALVLYGHCDAELGVPFQPFVEALAYYIAHEESPELGRHAGDLTRLLPELAGRMLGLPSPLRSDPETERFRLFEAVALWLAAASATQPLLLVLDDLHWAANSTLLLLRHVLHATAGTVAARLLVLGTYRDTDVDRTHPLAELLADLRRSSAERLNLGGLNEAGVVELIQRTAGEPLVADGLAIARTVHRETEGNPFFIGEVIRHLAETGAIVRRDDGWALTGVLGATGIPEGVREVIGRRLARLSETANAALTVAAVIGREFDLDTLAAVCDIGADALLNALEPVVVARLLEETGTLDTYRFAHALVRETLYGELSASRRVRWHRKIAEEIARRRPDDVAALAYHYGEAAAGGDIERAVEYAARAGDQAKTRLAYDQALAYYRQALELLTAGASPAPTRQLCELLIRRGEAERDAGEAGYRETLLAAARMAQDLAETDLLARAALANTRGYFSAVGKVDPERVAVLEAALGAIGKGEDARQARLLATLVNELTYSRERAQLLALDNEALTIARRLDDPGTLAYVLRNRYVAIWSPATLAERLATTAEHVRLAESLSDPSERRWAAGFRALASLEAGDVPDVDRHLAMVAQLTEELGQPALRWNLTRFQAWREQLAGHTEEAEKLATESLQVGQATGQPDALTLYASHLFDIRRAQGRLAELEPLTAQLMASNPGLPVIRALMAALYCELGQGDDARPLLERDAADDFSAFSFDALWLMAMTHYARASAHLGAQGPAALLSKRLAPWKDQIAHTATGVNGAVTLYLGLLAHTLGHYDSADGYFLEAYEMHKRIRAPYWVATTRVDWARMRLNRNQPDDSESAHAMLTDALATAREHQFASVERQAVRLLAAS